MTRILLFILPCLLAACSSLHPLHLPRYPENFPDPGPSPIYAFYDITSPNRPDLKGSAYVHQDEYGRVLIHTRILTGILGKDLARYETALEKREDVGGRVTYRSAVNEPSLETDFAFYLRGDRMIVEDRKAETVDSFPWKPEYRILGVDAKELLELEPGDEIEVLCFDPQIRADGVFKKTYRIGEKLEAVIKGREVGVRPVSIRTRSTEVVEELTYNSRLLDLPPNQSFPDLRYTRFKPTLPKDAVGVAASSMVPAKPLPGQKVREKTRDKRTFPLSLSHKRIGAEGSTP